MPAPKEDLAPAGTHAGTHAGLRSSALQLWEPCTYGCPTATHLREVTGQPIAVAGACGGPQGEVEGPELAGSYSLRGDVELAGGTVPQGHPAAGKLGRGKRVEPVPHRPPRSPPTPRPYHVDEGSDEDEEDGEDPDDGAVGAGLDDLLGELLQGGGEELAGGDTEKRTLSCVAEPPHTLPPIWPCTHSDAGVDGADKEDGGKEDEDANVDAKHQRGAEEGGSCERWGVRGPGPRVWGGCSTHWGNTTIWRQQMKQKTRRVQAT